MRILVPVILVFLLFLVVFMFYEQVRYTLRTRASYGVVSQSNSLVVATPTCVPSDGESRSRLYIYCNNARGFGEPHMQVKVSPVGEAYQLEIIPIQGITDENGKAIFDVTSLRDGQVGLRIKCADTTIAAPFYACFTR